jgi:hypothetical protein
VRSMRARAAFFEPRFRDMIFSRVCASIRMVPANASCARRECRSPYTVGNRRTSCSARSIRAELRAGTVMWRAHELAHVVQAERCKPAAPRQAGNRPAADWGDPQLSDPLPACGLPVATDCAGDARLQSICFCANRVHQGWTVHRTEVLIGVSSCANWGIENGSQVQCPGVVGELQASHP